MATALALDHLVLVVSDVERALAWYGQHAGLAGVRVDEWRATEAPFPSLRVDDSTIIDLIPGNPGADRGHLDHICFVVRRAGSTAWPGSPTSRWWTVANGSGPEGSASRSTSATPTGCWSSSAAIRSSGSRRAEARRRSPGHSSSRIPTSSR